MHVLPGVDAGPWDDGGQRCTDVLMKTVGRKRVVMDIRQSK